ncbi:putative folate-biopterin transporter 2 [Drosera capensis]
MRNEDDDEGLVAEVYDPRMDSWRCVLAPYHWLRMLAMELHWSFVFGVIVVYGISQGLGGSFSRVATEYYWKDVQQVQPAEAQIYDGITSIPWMVKPLWGLCTDVVPMFGYRRRPYFIMAGLSGIASMLFISLHKRLHILLAELSLTARSAAVATADVTVDACVAENTNKHQLLAADMQSLCSLSSSTGALVGYFISGILVHLIGPKGVYGLLAIAPALVLLAGVLLKEPRVTNLSCRQVSKKSSEAAQAMWTTLKLPEVWRPCLYMYLSLGLSLDIKEGMFYWYTSASDGKLKWMPLVVLSAKLCPPGIEGTFFALLMSIDNVGFFTSSWGGGVLMHILGITPTSFGNLWIGILVRNIRRIGVVGLLFLIPRADPASSILSTEVVNADETVLASKEENIELVSLINNDGNQ